jgi:hypothetical protein
MHNRILDGFPRTYEEAKLVFADRGEGDDTEPADDATELDMVIDNKFKPNVVSFVSICFVSFVNQFFKMYITLSLSSIHRLFFSIWQIMSSLDESWIYQRNK